MWLARTAMGKVGAYMIFHGSRNTVVGWHGYGRGRAHKIFHGSSNSMIGWCGYGDIGRIKCFTEPALMCLAGTSMSEVGAHKVFHGATINVVGWHDYGRGREP